MPRAIGANCRVRMFPETGGYGVVPGGNWRNMPFTRGELGAARGFIDADVIGVATNRDAAAPFDDLTNVTGSLTVPVDLVNVGHWLRLFFGAPTTTGSTPNFIHTFASGAATIPSNSIELGYPDVPSFERVFGVRGDTLDIDFSPSGAATMTCGLIGQGSIFATTTGAGTPTTATYTAFNRSQGSISRSGAALAQVTGATLRYTNAIEAVRTIRADGLLEGADPSIARCTGTITARFENTTLLDQARTSGVAEFAMAYTIDANRSLTFTLPEVRLELARRPIEGPNGVSATFNYRAAFNTAATRMLTVVLRNNEAAAIYA